MTTTNPLHYRHGRAFRLGMLLTNAMRQAQGMGYTIHGLMDPGVDMRRKSCCPLGALIIVHLPHLAMRFPDAQAALDCLRRTHRELVTPETAPVWLEDLAAFIEGFELVNTTPTIDIPETRVFVRLGRRLRAEFAQATA